MNRSPATSQRQARLTKPPGALGHLEAFSVRLSGIFGTPRPDPQGVAVIVTASDHGVAAEGVSAFPQAVTAAMVGNFLLSTPAGPGGAANALTRSVGARVYVMDVSVAAELPDHPALIRAAVRLGSRKLRPESAMTREETAELILADAAAARRAIDAGADHLLPGEMGSANTTAASPLTARLLGLEAAQVTGRGTGIDDAGLIHKA